MYQTSSVLKRISLVLGITTLLLGLIPLPVLGQVGMVSAEDGGVMKKKVPNPTSEEPVVEEPAAEEPPVEAPVVEQPPADKPVVEEPPAEEPPVEEPLVEDPAAEKSLPEEPPLEDPLVEDPPLEESMSLMSEPLTLTLLSLSMSVGPTDETPEDLGLPEDENAEGYQDDCDQPENDCEKEEGAGLGDVNEVDEGETFEQEADVVVIKAGTEEFFFSPDGPECDPEIHPYCVIWNDDGTITVVRNEESSEVKDISNIQFWNGDGKEEPVCEDRAATNFGEEGECEYDEIPGCIDQAANNFDPEATEDDGSCEYDVPGCVDQAATNYDPNATEDDGSCEYEEQDPLGLTLGAVCTPGEGGYYLAWSVNNPNGFLVDATWDLNGSNGAGSMAPGSNFIGNTPMGSASYTLNVSWDSGRASKSAQALCQPEVQDDPPDDTTTVAFTAAPQDPLIIPVTGVDLDGEFPLFRRAMLLAGSVLMTSGLFMKGTTKKEKKLKK